MAKVIYETRTLTLTRRVKVRTSTPTMAGYRWEGTPAIYAVTAEFAVDEIIHELANRATRSKSGKASALRGKIVVKVKPQ